MPCAVTKLCFVTYSELSVNLVAAGIEAALMAETVLGRMVRKKVILELLEAFNCLVRKDVKFFVVGLHLDIIKKLVIKE